MYSIYQTSAEKLHLEGVRVVKVVRKLWDASKGMKTIILDDHEGGAKIPKEVPMDERTLGAAHAEPPKSVELKAKKHISDVTLKTQEKAKKESK